MKRLCAVIATVFTAIGMTSLTALSAQAGTGNPPVDDDVVVGSFVAHDWVKYDGGQGDGFEPAQKSTINGPQSVTLERPDKANAGTAVEVDGLDLELESGTFDERRTATVSYDVSGLDDGADKDKVLRFFVKVDGQ